MAIALGDLPAGSPAPAKPTLLTHLIELLDGTADGPRRARAQAELDRLDDRTLRDIGIDRTEISSILHHDLQDPSRRRR